MEMVHFWHLHHLICILNFNICTKDIYGNVEILLIGLVRSEGSWPWTARFCRFLYRVKFWIYVNCIVVTEKWSRRILCKFVFPTKCIHIASSHWWDLEVVMEYRWNHYKNNDHSKILNIQKCDVYFYIPIFINFHGPLGFVLHNYKPKNLCALPRWRSEKDTSYP